MLGHGTFRVRAYNETVGVNLETVGDTT